MAPAHIVLITLFVMVATLSSSCDRTGMMSMAEDTQAFSIIKQISTFQSIASADLGGFIPTVAQMEMGGMASRDIVDVAAAQAAGKGVAGHLFTDIVQDENGAPLDSQMRYGMAVTPQGGAGRSFLLLMDQSKMRIPEGGGAVSAGEEIQYYESFERMTVDGRWPTAAELAKWTRIQMRTPEQGAAEAERVKKEYDESRTR